MRRTIIGFGVGWVSGVLILAGLGASAGLSEGGQAVVRPELPARLMADLKWTFIYVSYYWWLFGAIGAILGAASGFGSWLVRPRKHQKADLKPKPLVHSE